MVNSASRKKVTAVLSETRVVEQMELMLSLSDKELSLLETRIVKRFGDKPSDRLLKKLRVTIRLITLFRVAGEVLLRGSSEKLGRQVSRVRRRGLRASMRMDKSHG